MATVTISLSMTAGGVGAAGQASKEVAGQVGIDPTLPAGQAGTLTTRTDNDTGVITLDASAIPTVTAASTVSVFWNGGYRYGVDVTAVAGSTVSIDIGSGDNLPVAATAVVIAEEVVIDLDLDGDLMTAWVYSCSNESHIRFMDDIGTTPATLIPTRLDANEPAFFFADNIYTNPFTNREIGRVIFANAGTTAVKVALAIGYDAQISP
jgi:hypothetical protein